MRSRDVALIVALSLLAAGPALATTGAKQGPSSSVRQLQQRLQSQGLYGRGLVDGVYGPGTRAAVEAFQRARRMAVTGQMDAETMAAMDLDHMDAEPAPADGTGGLDVKPDVRREAKR